MQLQSPETGDHIIITVAVIKALIPKCELLTYHSPGYTNTKYVNLSQPGLHKYEVC